MGAAGAGAIVQGLSEMGTNMINSAGLALNQHIAGQNITFQNRAQLANLLLQKMAWDREDTAVQRRVKDLEAAGLNKVLAAGSAAQSSPAMRVEPNENRFQFPMNAIKSNIGETIIQAGLTQSQIAKMDSEKQRLDTLTLLDVLTNPYKVANLSAKNKVLAEDLLTKQLDNYRYKLYGTSPKGGSEVGRTIGDTSMVMDRIAEGVINRAKAAKKFVTGR